MKCKKYRALTIVSAAASAFAVAGITPAASAESVGFADTVLDFTDSGAGPIDGPYGGIFGTGAENFPVAVSTDVVLGDDPDDSADFLSLPNGTSVTVGFSDETVVDGSGDDIFIEEVGDAQEDAQVLVSNDNQNFTDLGIADGGQTTSFDLSDIGFTQPVTALRLIGLDAEGQSPGFDVANVEVLPGSIGEPAPPDAGTSVPSPAALPAGLLLLGSVLVQRRRRRGRTQ